MSPYVLNLIITFNLFLITRASQFFRLQRKYINSPIACCHRDKDNRIHMCRSGSRGGAVRKVAVGMGCGFLFPVLATWEGEVGQGGGNYLVLPLSPSPDEPRPFTAQLG